MARLRIPPPAAVSGDVPELLTRPLDPAWRDPAAVIELCRRERITADLGFLADRPSGPRYRGIEVSRGIDRWRHVVTCWALPEGIGDPEHPGRPDWHRLGELGIRAPRALERARAVGMVAPSRP